MKIDHIVGARPNFMKVSPVYAALSEYEDFNQRLIHTGQHYDIDMSDIFFSQLQLPSPDVNLSIGSGTHTEQTAGVMLEYETYLRNSGVPDLTLVYGDVNSTIACALVCSKMGIPVGHVEAGLRSFDMGMPEEINRILTDRISTMLFTPSQDADLNLLNEGVSSETIFLVGNVMIDTLMQFLPQSKEKWNLLCGNYDLQSGQYGLVTLHRPSNVDEEDALRMIISTLDEVAETTSLIMPVHPRTRLRMQQLSIMPAHLRIIPPLGYIDFLSLQYNSRFVITDSGGVQEETTFLGVPCITVRSNTERPVTIDVGTSTLVGQNMDLLKKSVNDILDGDRSTGIIPDLWDGSAATRIAKIIHSQYATI